MNILEARNQMRNATLAYRTRDTCSSTALFQLTQGGRVVKKEGPMCTMPFDFVPEGK